MLARLCALISLDLGGAEDLHLHGEDAQQVGLLAQEEDCGEVWVQSHLQRGRAEHHHRSRGVYSVWVSVDVRSRWL